MIMVNPFFPYPRKEHKTAHPLPRHRRDDQFAEGNQGMNLFAYFWLLILLLTKNELIVVIMRLMGLVKWMGHWSDDLSGTGIGRESLNCLTVGEGDQGDMTIRQGYSPATPQNAPRVEKNSRVTQCISFFGRRKINKGDFYRFFFGIPTKILWLRPEGEGVANIWSTESPPSLAISSDHPPLVAVPINFHRSPCRCVHAGLGSQNSSHRLPCWSSPSECQSRSLADTSEMGPLI